MKLSDRQRKRIEEAVRRVWPEATVPQRHEVIAAVIEELERDGRIGDKKGEAD